MVTNKYLLTVFTPTYNRAYSLPKLYESLKKQTNKDFEWLIVDDGSTDSTEELIDGFISENVIRILYIHQPNGGKHRAINRGLREANGELFIIVDSDDFLTDDAVETICEKWESVRSNSKVCGVAGLKIYQNGEKVGGGSFKDMTCSFLDFRYKYGIKGDMAEVVRTNIFRNYSFPEIPNEKFCPESLVWNRIAKDYDCHYFFKGIYVCEYLPDGLTAKITRIRHNSPVASCMHYVELSAMSIPLSQKIKAAINFWRFYTKRYEKQRNKLNSTLSIVGYIPGKLMRLRDKHNKQL